MPNGNTSTQTTPPDGMGDGGVPDTRGDLRAANTAAQAFNNFTGIINDMVAFVLLMGLGMDGMPVNPWSGQQLITGFGSGVDPVTGMPLEGPWEAKDLAPVDLPALKGKVDEMAAQVTTAHKLARTVYHMLKYHVQYEELGALAFEQK